MKLQTEHSMETRLRNDVRRFKLRATHVKPQRGNPRATVQRVRRREHKTGPRRQPPVMAVAGTRR